MRTRGQTSYASRKTIDVHQAHILAKLNATSVAEFVKHVIREGFTSSDPKYEARHDPCSRMGAGYLMATMQQ
jgi:hypothetical protein